MEQMMVAGEKKLTRRVSPTHAPAHACWIHQDAQYTTSWARNLSTTVSLDSALVS